MAQRETFTLAQLRAELDTVAADTVERDDHILVFAEGVGEYLLITDVITERRLDGTNIVALVLAQDE